MAEEACGSDGAGRDAGAPNRWATLVREQRAAYEAWQSAGVGCFVERLRDYEAASERLEGFYEGVRARLGAHAPTSPH